MKVIVRAGVAGTLFGAAFFALGSGAWAQQDGPTPPEVGDPAGANVAPHGGYSSASNFCLQCHEVHNAAGAYALMWKNSVTNTCATCHGYMGQPFTGTRNPIGPGTIGTTSVRSVYNVSGPGHDIGATNPPSPDSGIDITQSDWSYGGWRFPPPAGPPPVDATTPAGPGTASAASGGLYCASCHTPHGEYGQAANTRKVRVTDATGDLSTLTTKDWAGGTQIWWDNPSGGWEFRYLHQDADPAGVWEVCTSYPPTPVAGGPDATCAYAQVEDAEGQLVYLFGYKLLTAFPNHTYSQVQSYTADEFNHDGALWCSTCHPSKLDDEFPGGTLHNHPTGCGACHGNPADGSSADFPHSSTKGALLQDLPDALCVNCHVAGSLP